MTADLHSGTADEPAVQTAEFIVSSARLAELYDCSALLRRTRTRAEEIVDEARALLAEAERRGDAERALTLRDHLEQARGKYCQVLGAYLTICRRINEERQEILRAQMERDRTAGLSGVA
ncbi:hypothetical protein [Nonomuraea candida]|uniref:hypothetical protein n=1 Tax=Nonomuraea candida TaxID=359159 RepID=UPI0005BD854E|nr:hypothetical protein [Nonomuraea candida]